MLDQDKSLPISNNIFTRSGLTESYLDDMLLSVRYIQYTDYIDNLITVWGILSIKQRTRLMSYLTGIERTISIMARDSYNGIVNEINLPLPFNTVYDILNDDPHDVGTSYDEYIKLCMSIYVSYSQLIITCDRLSHDKNKNIGLLAANIINISSNLLSIKPGNVITTVSVDRESTFSLGIDRYGSVPTYKNVTDSCAYNITKSIRVLLKRILIVNDKDWVSYIINMILLSSKENKVKVLDIINEVSLTLSEINNIIVGSCDYVDIIKRIEEIPKPETVDSDISNHLAILGFINSIAPIHAYVINITQLYVSRRASNMVLQSRLYDLNKLLDRITRIKIKIGS